ncbi:MAG: hypothetical protein JJU06_13610 [Ectothiorhodospiraceae bacterium]|nr:hypothetical protein [Ectothiorhodospiraceae bacterium]MCH8505197.1 hypothetical protein [Ectothiorhodospiraceae bacterium]
MNYIAIDNVAEGKELAHDIRGVGGEILAPKGRKIDMSLIQGLRNRGVNHIPLQQIVPEAQAMADRARLEASLDHVFRHWRMSPAMRHLRSMLVEHRLSAHQFGECC